MKLIIFISLFIFFIPVNLLSQDFGLRLGIGLSNAKVGNEAGKNFANNLFAISVSGNKKFSLSNSSMVGVEVQTISKGYRFKIKNFLDQGEVGARMGMNVLSVNALFLWNPFEEPEVITTKKKRRKKIDKRKKTYLIGGVYNGFNFYSNWKYMDETTSNKDLKFPIKKYDLGLIGGLKIGRNISKTKNLSFDFRYYHGLLNVLDHPFNSIRMRNVEIGMQYYFFKKKKSRKRRKS